METHAERSVSLLPLHLNSDSFLWRNEMMPLWVVKARFGFLELIIYLPVFCSNLSVRHIALLWFSVSCWHVSAVCLSHFSSTTPPPPHPPSFARYFNPNSKIHQFSPFYFLLSRPPEFASPWHREPGVHVRDPGESVCGDGEAPRWHAGDDPLQWEGPAAWEAHQVPHHTGVDVPRQRGDLLFVEILLFTVVVECVRPDAALTELHGSCGLP